MSRTFSDSLAQDLESVFFNTNEFAELVTIKRGQAETEDVAAIVVERRYEIFDEDGVVTSYRAFDFDIITTAYVIRGAQVDPQQSDRIVRPNGDEYLVSAIPNGQHYEPTGSSGMVIRVHTKRFA